MMIRIMRATTIAAATIAVAFPAAPASAGAAAGPAPAKTWGTCKAMNKELKGGVARKAGLKNRHFADRKKPLNQRRIVAFSYQPKVDAKLYKQNIGLDSDLDGIACER